MTNDNASNRILDGLRSAIRLYLLPRDQGITGPELINHVFLHFGWEARFDLVAEVAQLLPKSVHGELRRVVEAILQPGSGWLPSTIGVPQDVEAWRRRMRPACQQLAILFRQHLDRPQSVGDKAEE